MVDFENFLTYKNDQQIILSAREYSILQFFIQNKNKLVTRDDLLRNVWGYETVPCTRTVDMHICKLRQKIEDNPQEPKHLVTVHWAGYKFMD